MEWYDNNLNTILSESIYSQKISHSDKAEISILLAGAKIVPFLSGVVGKLVFFYMLNLR